MSTGSKPSPVKSSKNLPEEDLEAPCLEPDDVDLEAEPTKAEDPKPQNKKAPKAKAHAKAKAKASAKAGAKKKKKAPSPKKAARPKAKAEAKSRAKKEGAANKQGGKREKCFARRYKPQNEPAGLQWAAIRDAFNDHLRSCLDSPSKLEDMFEKHASWD